MNWITSFFSGSEHEVDSLVVGCTAAVVTVLAASVYIGLQEHSTWNPLSLSTGIATIFGAGHSAKALRDRTAPTEGDKP